MRLPSRFLSVSGLLAAGLLAAGLVWLSPNFLAHARLVTTDVGAACFMTLALWGWWRWLARRDRRSVVVAGVLGVVAGVGLCHFGEPGLHPLHDSSLDMESRVPVSHPFVCLLHSFVPDCRRFFSFAFDCVDRIFVFFVASRAI